MTDNIKEQMLAIGKQARKAAISLRNASLEQRNHAVTLAAKAILAQQDSILQANAKDIAQAQQSNLSQAMIDRLFLDEKRLQAIANSLIAITKLPDPVGKTMAEWQVPHNGLRIERRAVPMGVIGIIYESRPNVTADAGALAIKSGNAIILRGGSESLHSSVAIHHCIAQGLQEAGLPAECVQIVPVTDRQAVQIMLAEMADYIDILIPRGGKGLVGLVQKEARVPVLAHLEGICHSYIHQDADLEKAVAIVLNAKMRRTGICGATETLLIDAAIAKDTLASLLPKLLEKGCEIRGCEKSRHYDDRILPASEDDWHTEYLESILSVRIVDNIEQAIDHIHHYGSGHTEAILTENKQAADLFHEKVDSAIVIVNASTQFADGGEFGMGCEMGIATGRLHARGPVGLEQLTTYKYCVHGQGQCRP